MAVTWPSKRIWDAGGNNWASSAGAGDTPSAPSDAERVAGHVQNTGYTSGRANYCWQFVSEWLQKVKAVIDPQHADNGDHVAVVVTPSASGQVDLDAKSHASDSASQVKIRVKDSAGAASFTVASDGDVACEGDLSVAGTVVSAGEVVILPNDLSPLDFSDTAAGGDSDGTYQRGTTAEYSRFDVDDGSTRYLVSGTIQIPVGVVLGTLSVYFNRPTNSGQTITVTLRSKSWNFASGTSAASVSDATATTGNQAVTAAIGTPTVTGLGHFLLIELNNSTPGAGNAIKIIGVKIDWSVP